MTNKETSVLVVEDDSRTLYCERFILEGGGYHVAWASSGEEAIEIVADETPDLVILDVGLPGIDGFTTCKVIRKFSQVPIIMVTGNSSVPSKVQGLDTGADDYITKPFSDEELFARSKAVLRRSGQSVRARQIAQCVCSRESGRSNSTEYPHGLTPLFLLGKRWYWTLADTLRTWATSGLALRAKIPNWSVFVDRAGTALRRTTASACARANALAKSSKTTFQLAWKSPQASRVKNSPLSRELARLARHLLESGPLRKARYACSVQKKRGAESSAKLISSFGKHWARLRGPGQVDRDDTYKGPGCLQVMASLDLSAAAGSPQAAGDAHHLAFLEGLLRAYLKVAGTICCDPLVSAPVVPLVSVYEELVSQSWEGQGYSRERFAREVYELHRSGIDTTPTGARVQFPISRGVPSKTLLITDDSGEEVRYYGIRFMPVRNSYQESASVLRSFDVSAADHYGVEIKEAFARQIEWPSEEFVQFLAAQINLGTLDHKGSRQLAQIARDSLQQLIREQRQIDSPQNSTITPA